MNQPYVRQYNKDGSIKNPIQGSYLNQFPNRRQRHKDAKRERFKGNGKNTPLSIAGALKYLRVIQVEKDKAGKRKFIEHYILQ